MCAVAVADMAPRVLSGFYGISEFPDIPGKNKLPPIRVGCFTAAMMSVLASYDVKQWPLTPEEFVRLFDDMESHKDMDGHGTTMARGAAYVQQVLKLQTIEPAAWTWHPGTQVEAIRQGILAQGGINGCVLMLDTAGRMPTNEPGVGGHFVAIGGVKVVGGVMYVYLANGDDVLALAQHGGHGKVLTPRWLAWSDVVKGTPAALLAIKHPVASEVGVPQGWQDDQAAKLLHCPNGAVVEKGNRSYILAHGNWDPGNQPRMKHEVGDPTESFFDFRDCTMTWTSAGGIVVAPHSQTKPVVDYFLKSNPDLAVAA